MDTPVTVIDDIEWLWELALPDEAKRHLIHRVGELILSALNERRDEIETLRGENEALKSSNRVLMQMLAERDMAARGSYHNA